MKFSTRGRYGIRLLVDLAEHQSESHITLASIADRQKISARYLEQVAVILRRAGYIRSVKGASGGYALARNPCDIVIGDALRILEGDLLIVDDLRAEETENALQRCIRATVYNRLNERISGVLDQIMLSSMLGDSHSDQNNMYFI